MSSHPLVSRSAPRCFLLLQIFMPTSFNDADDQLNEAQAVLDAANTVSVPETCGAINQAISLLPNNQTGDIDQPTVEVRYPHPHCF